MANEMLEGLGITQAELNDWLKEPKKKKKEKPKESEVARKAREEGQRQAMEMSPNLVVLAKEKRAENKRKEEGFLSKVTGRREDLGAEALPVVQAMGRAAEREKFGGVGEVNLEAQHQREKKLMGGIGSMPPSQRAKLESAEAGGERMAFDDPRIAGRGSWRGKEEEMGGKSIPFTEEMAQEQGGRRTSPYRPDIMRDGKMDWRGKEKELGGESLDLSDPRNIGESIPFTEEMRKETAGDPNATGIQEWKASMDQGDIDQQMSEGQAKDEEERAVNEEFMMNASPEEKEEIINTVSEAMGPFAEETIAAKEATGEYVRYDGATKKGITINKTRLKQLYDQKGKMALLQHVPQENRAALMFNWGLISEKDLSDTQQQSAKEVLELEKIGLQIAELKNNAGNSTTKMSDQQKAEVTAASNGLAAAVKERRWDEAEGFQTQLNELMPDRKPLNIEKMQKSIDKKLLKRPKLQKVKGLMGTQVWDGYFTFKNDLVKKIDLLKVSKAGSGDLAAFLGGTAQAGENKGRTWSDILEGQGVPSWSTVDGMDKNSAKAKQIASRISGGKHKDITRISRGKYMGHVLPQMRQMIMKEQYGNWYTTIEKELHGAQAEATAEAQESVNSDGVQKPEPASPEAVVETTPKKLQSAIPEPPANAQGGPMATVPAPVEEEQVESTEADMIQLAEQNEVQRQKELAEQARIEKEGEELYPKWKLSKKQEDNLGGEKKKEYNRFKKWAPKLLEKSKNDPEFLQNLKEKYKESVKRKKAKGKNHYWEDYNLAYIKMLLNK